MGPVLKTLLTTFLKPLLYSAIPIVVGLFIAMANHLITTFQPTGTIEVELWKILILPALAGLVKLLMRLATWNPSKVGK